MNRFIRILIIINGLIIPAFFGYVFYQIFSNEEEEENEYYTENITVGERLEKAKEKGLAIQGLTYDRPRGIYNSTNYYLPLSVMTYEEAKVVKEIVSTQDNASASLYNYFNVLFLDKDYNVIGKLLDKKASISDIHTLWVYSKDNYIDTTAKYMAYLIGFEDSNNDGNLNSLDHQDLYISDLAGKNLVQVTYNKNIVEFDFINSHSEIFIHYKERNEIKDEHKRLKFGRYHIETGKFVELKDIDKALSEIEEQLIH